MKKHTVQQDISRIISKISPNQAKLPIKLFPQIFTEIESNFQITLSNKTWSDIHDFINNYPNFSIPRDQVISMLDELLGMDFLEYLLEKIEIKEISDDRSFILGSPLDFNRLGRKIGKANIEFDDSFDRLDAEATVRKVEPIWKRIIRYTHPFFLILNFFLLLIILASIGLDKDWIKRKCYMLVYNFFVYETNEDIYWWQRWDIIERSVWSILDL